MEYGPVAHNYNKELTQHGFYMGAAQSVWISKQDRHCRKNSYYGHLFMFGIEKYQNLAWLCHRPWHLDAFEPISFKFGLVRDMTNFYILILKVTGLLASLNLNLPCGLGVE